MEATHTRQCLDICIDEDSQGNITTRRLEAVFCDLDGVIVDSEPFKFFYYIKVLLRQGIPVDFLFTRKNSDGGERESFYDYYKRGCVGASGEENAKNQLEWLKQHGIDLGMSWQEFRNERMRHYKPIEDSLPLIEKNIDLIERLKQGYSETPVYIVSRTDEERTKKILGRASLDGKVEVAVVPEKGRKKYSRAVEEAQKRGIRLKDCLAIEDSLKGAQEAAEYGLKVVAVPTEFTMLQFRLAKSPDYLNADSVFRKLKNEQETKFVYFNPERPGHIQVIDSSWDYGDEDRDFIFYDHNPEKDEWEITETDGSGYHVTGTLARDSEIIQEYEKERKAYVLAQIAKLRLS